MATNEVDYIREGTYVSIVGNQNAKDVLKTIYNSVGDSYWDVAAILYHIKTKEIYKQAEHYDTPGRHERYNRKGHSGWKDYCESETPVSYRSVQYWINIYEYFTTMGIDKSRATEIGWHKAKLLVGVTDDVGVLESLLSAAKEQSIDDLKATVQSFNTSVGGTPGEIVRNKKFSFVLQEATGETIEQILETVSKTTEGSYNEAFSKIFIEWWQTNLPDLIANGHYTQPVESDELVVEEVEEKVEETPEPEEVETVTQNIPDSIEV